MKRFVCIAFVVALALAYQVQADANDLDGTYWSVTVLIHDPVTGVYIGWYGDDFIFENGELLTYWGWDWVPYWMRSGVPGLSWRAVVDDWVWSLTPINGVVFGNTMWGTIEAPWVNFYCSFYAVRTAAPPGWYQPQPQDEENSQVDL